MRKQRMLGTVLLVLGLGLTLFFGLRAYRDYQRFHNRPAPTDVETIQGWMTLPYIARSYQVPLEVLLQELNIPTGQGQAIGRLSLRELAEQQSRNPAEMREAIQHIILRHQQERPPHPGPGQRPPKGTPAP